MQHQSTDSNAVAHLAVEARGLVRKFGAVAALAGVSLSIRKGEFFSLLGPSGCGKTTLLRIMAGLELPDVGTLAISGVDMACVPAHLRPVNTVFQSYALFPHLTVRENVAFGLRMKRVPRAELEERVGRVMKLVQIGDLEARRPAELSGGQKQRVALARALVNEPEVLLLDEPLGALDLKLRKQLQLELHQLQRRLGITFIHVTHDQDEALVMSDRIAVMNAGRIEQIASAAEIYERPRTRFVAQFLGACNLIGGSVAGRNGDAVELQSLLGALRVRLAPGTEPGALESGRSVTVGIRPEKVRMRKTAGAPPGNTIRAQVRAVGYSGAETHYKLQAGEFELSAVAMNVDSSEAGFRIGEQADCQLPEAALVLLDD